MVNKVTIALGSNIEDPKQQIAVAQAWLSTLAENKSQHASLYRTPPMGPQDQPDFYNSVCQLETSLTPHALLAELQAQELRQHRKKNRHWGERSIDLDIVLFNHETINTDDLTVPHPGLYERLFVLMPLCEIAPELMLPNGQSVKQHCYSQLQHQAKAQHPVQV